MGERKGQNFYYPPDFNYKKHKSLNHYHGTHALRERAAKLDQGILIIRFEMPFNVWCLGCHNHIGMGVRYNAEKKKVGMYYTTPLYEFRMKCHLCDNYLVIRTDPKNFDYELTEGCSRQEKRYDPSTIAQVGAIDRAFTQKLAADHMFKAEHEAGDRDKATSDESRLEKLEWLQERGRNDYDANSHLRAQFRKEKKNLSEQRASDVALQEKLSIGHVKLAPVDPEDARRASMLTRYRSILMKDSEEEAKREEFDARRIFGESPATPSTSSLPSDRLLAVVRRQRDKKISEKFTGAPEAKLTASALGIRKKLKQEPEEAKEEEGERGLDDIDVRTCEAKRESGDLDDDKKHVEAPLSILAQQYGTSSDSE